MIFKAMSGWDYRDVQGADGANKCKETFTGNASVGDSSNICFRSIGRALARAVRLEQGAKGVADG